MKASDSPVYYSCHDHFSPPTVESIETAPPILFVQILEIILEKIVKKGFSYIGKPLISLFVKRIETIGSLPIDYWKRQCNVYPTNAVDEEPKPEPEPESAGEDRVFPFVERLQKLEVLLEELKKKPAEIPADKEHMLRDSLERIKSVEFDLNKTKSVGPY